MPSTTGPWDWLTRKGWQSIFRFEPTNLDKEITNALVKSAKQLEPRPKEILYSSMTFWEEQTGPAQGPAHWEERFRIDSQTGTLSTQLTRFSGINAMPVHVGEINTGKAFAIRHGAHALFLISRFALDDLVRLGLDELFMLVVSVKFHLFLVLRQTGDSQNFLLTASCDDGFFGSSVDKGIMGEIKGTIERPFILVSSVLCINARRLQEQLAKPIKDIRHRWIFPGAQHYSELLPVLLALASESWLSHFSELPEAYLKCFPRGSRPEVENSSFVLNISAQQWKDSEGPDDPEFRAWEFSVGYGPWTRDLSVSFLQGKVYGSRATIAILSVVCLIWAQFSDLMRVLRMMSLVSQRTNRSAIELLGGPV
ncbi:hypothetical protein ACJZ2D_013931 [Fusarium nematophilum]